VQSAQEYTTRLENLVGHSRLHTILFNRDAATEKDIEHERVTLLSGAIPFETGFIQGYNGNVSEDTFFGLYDAFFKAISGNMNNATFKSTVIKAARHYVVAA
jgi:hypothetical protein